MGPARDDDSYEYVTWVVVYDLAAEEIAEECKRQPVENRGLFMIVYASYLSWLARRAVESYFPPGSWPVVVPLVERELSKQQWYQADTMKAVLDSMVRHLPMTIKGRHTGASMGPWNEAVVAASLAGYTICPSTNIEFVLWDTIISGKILETIHKMAPNAQTEDPRAK